MTEDRGTIRAYYTARWWVFRRAHKEIVRKTVLQTYVNVAKKVMFRTVLTDLEFRPVCWQWVETEMQSTVRIV